MSAVNPRPTALAEATASATVRSQLNQRWRTLAPRERSALGLMAALVAALLVWLVAVQPAWHTLRASPAQLAQVEAQLQQMQGLAQEARTLRGAAPVSPTQAATALRAATERIGGGARIVIQGERATLSLTNAPSDALRSWLVEARSAARARPVELQLTRAGGGFSGSVIVAFGTGT